MKNNDCLSLLKLVLPGINPLLDDGVHVVSVADVVDVTRRSRSVTIHCLAMQDQREYSSECPWIARKYRKCLEELEFMQHTEAISSVLLLLPGS